jgi:hypothetical protein
VGPVATGEGVAGRRGAGNGFKVVGANGMAEEVVRSVSGNGSDVPAPDLERRTGCQPSLGGAEFDGTLLFALGLTGDGWFVCGAGCLRGPKEDSDGGSGRSFGG